MAFVEQGVTITNYFAKTTDWSSYVDLPGAIAFGNNSNGQLGAADVTHRSSPTTVKSGSSWTDVAGQRLGAGIWFINQDNKLFHTGSLAPFVVGQNSSAFNSIQTSKLWTQVSRGYRHTSALRTDGTLWSWGLNTFGELGLNDLTNRSSPVQVGKSLWTQVAGGDKYTLAIRTDGTLWSWGSNFYGQLGLS
ncbi:MAG: RCC1 domain-containing protein, partial [Pseudomonadota bacterium]